MAVFDKTSALIKRTGPYEMKRPLGRLLLTMAWGTPRARTAREVGARMMTKRKFLLPSSWRSLRNPITGAPRARKLKPFSNMARRATLARPTKRTRAGSCATTDDRAQFSQPPPSYGLLRNPITGVLRARKLKLFSNMARRNPFRAGSWRNDDDKAQISKPPSYGSLRNPITGVPRARKLKLFSKMARRNPFSSYAGSPYKKRVGKECRARGN